MGVFVVVVLVVLALVAGAWLKLAPTAAERRRARLRQAAMAGGLQVRWIPAAELAGHGLPAGTVWYVLAAPDKGRPARVVVRGATPWPTGKPVPSGVLALKFTPLDVAVAWDEADEAGVAEIRQLLRELATPGAG